MPNINITLLTGGMNILRVKIIMPLYYLFMIPMVIIGVSCLTCKRYCSALISAVGNITLSKQVNALEKQDYSWAAVQKLERHAVAVMPDQYPELARYESGHSGNRATPQLS